MKNLKDTIYEKLKVDDIVIEEFPIDGTMEKMIKFLKSERFKEITDANIVSVSFEVAKNKCFHQSDNRLWFADTSNEEISKDNPIFLIEDQLQPRFIVFYIENSVTKWLCDNNKKKFLKELNKRFGWQ